VVAVGLGPQGLRDEAVPGNLAHDGEDAGIVDAAGRHELGNHLAPLGFLPAPA